MRAEPSFTGSPQKRHDLVKVAVAPDFIIVRAQTFEADLIVNWGIEAHQPADFIHRNGVAENRNRNARMGRYGVQFPEIRI